MTNPVQPRWIDHPDGIARLADCCRQEGRLALDTEADSLHSYFHKVCLIQVSVGGEHAVIDPLKLDAADLEPLWNACADPSLTVLMHGSDYDFRVLDRDFGASIRGLRDTQIMAQLLGEPKTGLAALLDGAFGIQLDKRYQRADWGRRPLPRGMIDYAALDTAHLEALGEHLQRRLEQMGRWSWALEDFRKLEETRFQSPEPNPMAFERVKGVGKLRGEARDRAFGLFQWREAEAQRRDLPPFKVMGNPALHQLALEGAADPRALERIDGLGPRFVGRYGRSVLKVVQDPPEAPARRRGPRKAPLEPSVKDRINRLIRARDLVAADLNLDGSLLCPRAGIETIASNGMDGPPGSPDGPALHGWRRSLLEPAFKPILNEA